jgi:hypothetical protein
MIYFVITLHYLIQCVSNHFAELVVIVLFKSFMFPHFLVHAKFYR